MPSTPKVLIVDDDEPSRVLAADVIRSIGCEVAVGENGCDAVAMATAHRPDLILMDMRMPVMSGIDASRCLKSQKETKGIPIIAVTAFAMLGDETRILGSGCDGYLAKPTTPSKIIRIVSRFLVLRPSRALKSAMNRIMAPSAMAACDVGGRL